MLKLGQKKDGDSMPSNLKFQLETSNLVINCLLLNICGSQTGTANKNNFKFKDSRFQFETLETNKLWFIITLLNIWGSKLEPQKRLKT